MSKPRCPKHSDVEQATHLVRNSGLGAIAAKCLRLALAAARDKHREPWQLWHGYYAVREELNAWLAAEEVGDKENAKREFGNILHAVLSLGAHMGYDIEAALCDVIWRNAERARSGE